MSAPAANCPNCGAPISFRWSSAVQTTCPFCHSILVRTDVDLRKVGQVADLPENSSPIQIATEGIYENRSFVVIGRILYAYDQGAWNEWHVIFNDGASGWIADAQLEYDVSFLRPAPPNLPSAVEMHRPYALDWNNRHYEATSLTRAHYKGVEGELPFEYWDKNEVLFADLRTAAGEFATIDYTDQPPSFFEGRAVPFADLHFKNLRDFEGWST